MNYEEIIKYLNDKAIETNLQHILYNLNNFRKHMDNLDENLTIKSKKHGDLLHSYSNDETVHLQNITKNILKLNNQLTQIEILNSNLPFNSFIKLKIKPIHTTPHITPLKNILIQDLEYYTNEKINSHLRDNFTTVSIKSSISKLVYAHLSASLKGAEVALKNNGVNFRFHCDKQKYIINSIKNKRNYDESTHELTSLKSVTSFLNEEYLLVIKNTITDLKLIYRHLNSD